MGQSHKLTQFPMRMTFTARAPTLFGTRAGNALQNNTIVTVETIAPLTARGFHHSNGMPHPRTANAAAQVRTVQGANQTAPYQKADDTPGASYKPA